MSPRIVDIPLRFARCQLVLGDVPTLIDAGTLQDLQRIVAALAREGLQPRDLRRIILTHADGDHAGGAAADPDPIEPRLSRRGQRYASHTAISPDILTSASHVYARDGVLTATCSRADLRRLRTSRGPRRQWVCPCRTRCRCSR